MKDWLKQMVNSWSWQQLLVTALIFVATFTVSLAIVSFILVKLPPDYFKESSERNFLEGHPKWVRIAVGIGKNVLGAIPILLGIMLLDFPGKRRLEHKIVSRPKVKEAIDRLRHRFGKPPMQLD